MNKIFHLFLFSFLSISFSVICPPNTIAVTGQCQGKSACSFSGVDPSRYIIKSNSCDYCSKNFIAQGDDCIECPKNTFGTLSDNSCHSKNECSFNGVDPSRYVIKSHGCDYCSKNFVAQGDDCIECPKNTFSTHLDNSCHSRNECSPFNGVNPSRYVIKSHGCDYCSRHFIAQGDDCIECPKNTFGTLSDNSCHGKNECSFNGADPSRYVIKSHGCDYCSKNFIAQGDDCIECPKNTFGTLSDNSCHSKNECSFNGVHPSRYVIKLHGCDYCSKNFIAQGDDCIECPKNTFGTLLDNSCHSKNECFFNGVDPSRYVIKSHGCDYCSNGKLAYGDDCMNVNEYPFFENIDKNFLLPAEQNITFNLQALLSNFRKSLEENFQIKVKDLGEEIKNMTVGDPVATIGTMIAGLKISCQAVDILKNKFSTLMMNTFSQYVDNLGEMAEYIKSSKFFAGLTRSLEKVETVYGYVIPIGLKQYDDFKNKVKFNKHVSDLVSETFITWGTIEISSEIAAAIGVTVFGGAAIPTAIAGFAIGVGVQVISDGLITVKGKTPADFIRDGFDKLFLVDKKFLMIE